MIVSPPYRELAVFAHYNTALLWLAVAAFLFSEWKRSFTGTGRAMAIAVVGLAVVMSFHNPISHIQNNAGALAWSILFLLPPLFVAASDFIRRASTPAVQDRHHSIAYSDAAFVGALAGLISVAAPRLIEAARGGALLLQPHDAELMFWAVVEHITVALLAASVINLIQLLLSTHTKNALVLDSGVIGCVAFVGLAFGCVSLVEDSLSLRGWPAWSYSILFAATLTLCGMALLAPVLNVEKRDREKQWLSAAITLFLLAFVIYVPLAVNPGDDWNGILHQTITLLLWAILAIGITRARSLQKRYAIGTILVITLITCGIYEALNHSKLLWAADVGPNQALVLQELRNYSAQNTSFGLADRILGNEAPQPCDASCKTLRQYSNIPHAVIGRELNLVDRLSPVTGPSRTFSSL